MPDLQSPFFEKDIPCPACGETFPQRLFRSRMFAPGEKENDEHVTDYRWLAENARRVHPPHYFLMHCPKCHFTDIADEYREPGANPFHRRLLKTFNAAGQRDKLILELLSRHVNYEEIEYESALNLHLVATYAQMLLPADTQDCYKIARLLLRVAWLYRENRPDADGELQIPSVRDIEEATLGFETVLQKARDQWGPLGAALTQRTEEIDQQGESEASPYRSVHTELAKHIEGLSTGLHALKALCRRDLSGRPLSDDPDTESSPSYFSFQNYEAFFAKIKGVWSSAPADEMEAMRAAISYFDRSISTDPRFDDARKHFSAISLITKLMVRCGDLDGAVGMVRSIYKSASDSRQRAQTEMRSKETDEATKRRLKGQIERFTASLQDAGELRRGLIEQLMARDLPKIKSVLSKNEGVPGDVVEKALAQAGIADELISRMKEPGGRLEHLAKKKKKRFF